MGFPGRVSFRVGLGRETTAEDVERFLTALGELTAELRRVQALSDAAMSRYLPRPEG
jgi:cysteine sulfinate desulfinase/cysteine desulfurase-like protein